MKCKCSIFFSFFILLQNTCSAAVNSGVCQHYYASIKSSKANAHAGPGKNYKVSWEYVVKGVPVMITAKYDHWRRVKDPAGAESWIHKSLLSPKRFVITTKETPSQLMDNSNESAKIIAEIKKNVVMALLTVRGNWCKVEVNHKTNKYTGWIKKDSIFGVSDGEIWS